MFRLNAFEMIFLPSAVSLASLPFSEVLGSCSTETPCCATPVSQHFILSFYNRVIWNNSQTHFHTCSTRQAWDPALSSSKSLELEFQTIKAQRLGYPLSKIHCPFFVPTQTNSPIAHLDVPNHTPGFLHTSTTSLMPH